MENKQWTPQEMGRKGGKKSKRTLTPVQAREMVKKKMEKKNADKSKTKLD